MHFQIFQMALNSCCTFWRPSICEISTYIIWSFLCASFCFFSFFFLSILCFLPYSFLPSLTLRLLVILANIFINSRHIFWYLDAWITGLLIDIFGGPHQSVACLACQMEFNRQQSRGSTHEGNLWVNLTQTDGIDGSYWWLQIYP